MEYLIYILNLLQSECGYSPDELAEYAMNSFSHKEIAELKNYSTQNMGDSVIVAIHDLL